MLSQIIEKFKKKELISVSELAASLNSTENAVEGMLQILVRKNRIKVWSPNCKSCISSCSACNLMQQKYYQWIST
jgi:predicted transcriptional regulator